MVERIGTASDPQSLVQKLELRQPGRAGQRGDPPARYLIVPGAKGAASIDAGLRRLLPNEPFDIARTPDGEVILAFTARTFRLGDAFAAADAARALGHSLASELGATVVEPDLPRASAPAQPPDTKGLESIDHFPPGCWAREERELEDRKWALHAIGVPEAWALSEKCGRPSRGKGIVIAQPDTGVATHAELDGVTRADGFNTLGDGPENDATDPLDGGLAANPGHGTATASVVVSPDHGRDDEVVGSAPLALHLPIRAIRSVWLHEEIPIARAVDRAVEAGAHVITMSLGGAPLPFSPLRRAIRRAVARHVIVMAAAGNCVGVVVCPARFDECIAVAGTDSAGRKWRGSCSGFAVDISAPGQNVYRASVEPRPGGSVGQGQGTSFAVALTAGVAACWLAHHGRDHLIAEAEKHGETLQAMFRRLVRASAHRPPEWDGANMGAGIVNALKLIEAPLDQERGLESGAFEPRERAPADELRAFLTELLGADPGLTDGFILAHGTELASALLARKLHPGSGIPLSPALRSGLTGPAKALF